MLGRIPRPVGDLISDSKALTISPQLHREQQVLQPKLLRAEALTALAQFSASRAVKRAILRRTPNQTDLSALQPGEAVAFWRMSGAFDPDRKSCWVQLGKTLFRIGTAQLRAAAGWENWSPSECDLQLIRSAENNFASGMWLDEVTEGPP